MFLRVNPTEREQSPCATKWSEPRNQLFHDFYLIIKFHPIGKIVKSTDQLKLRGVKLKRCFARLKGNLEFNTRCFYEYTESGDLTRASHPLYLCPIPRSKQCLSTPNKWCPRKWHRAYKRPYETLSEDSNGHSKLSELYRLLFLYACSFLSNGQIWPFVKNY